MKANIFNIIFLNESITSFKFGDRHCCVVGKATVCSIDTLCALLQAPAAPLAQGGRGFARRVFSRSGRESRLLGKDCALVFTFLLMRPISFFIFNLLHILRKNRWNSRSCAGRSASRPWGVSPPAVTPYTGWFVFMGFRVLETFPSAE